MIAGAGLIQALIWLIIIGCIFGLLWWLIGYIGLPAPFDKVARVVVAIVAVLLLVNFLLGIAGGTPFVRWR